MYKRFFAFGCSFTSYYWPTWADIIGHEFQEENYINLGMCGGGNEFIFHRLTEAHARYNINKDDLVIICWTNFAREDRYMAGKWRMCGNIFSQTRYSKEWIDQYFDLRGALLKTSSVIAAATHLLDTTGCEYMFTSMTQMRQIDQHDVLLADEEFKDIFAVYNRYYDNIQLSMYDHLYHVDGKRGWRNPKPVHVKLSDDEHPGYKDNHPTPLQHLDYTTSIILPKLKQNITLGQTTLNWTQQWDDKLFAANPFKTWEDGWTPEFRYNKWHKNMC